MHLQVLVLQCIHHQQLRPCPKESAAARLSPVHKSPLLRDIPGNLHKPAGKCTCFSRTWHNKHIPALQKKKATRGKQKIICYNTLALLPDKQMEHERPVSTCWDLSSVLSRPCRAQENIYIYIFFFRITCYFYFHSKFLLPFTDFLTMNWYYF